MAWGIVTRQRWLAAPFLVIMPFHTYLTPFQFVTSAFESFILFHSSGFSNSNLPWFVKWLNLHSIAIYERVRFP